MRLVRLANVPAERRVSPKGTFELFRQHVSLALGSTPDTGPWQGRHPFDVERVRMPPGKKNFPYHSHAAQTEFYIVLSGTGTVTDDTGAAIAIQAGDHFIFFPGEAHQIQSGPDCDLEYYVIADNHRADVTTYPQTGKRAIKPEGRTIFPEEVDYYAGEE
jgi:uncharacterized cupin superfamily protein